MESRRNFHKDNYSCRFNQGGVISAGFGKKDDSVDGSTVNIASIDVSFNFENATLMLFKRKSIRQGMLPFVRIVIEQERMQRVKQKFPIMTWMIGKRFPRK